MKPLEKRLFSLCSKLRHYCGEVSHFCHPHALKYLASCSFNPCLVCISVSVQCQSSGETWCCSLQCISFILFLGNLKPFFIWEAQVTIADNLSFSFFIFNSKLLIRHLIMFSLLYSCLFFTLVSGREQKLFKILEILMSASLHLFQNIPYRIRWPQVATLSS